MIEIEVNFWNQLSLDRAARGGWGLATVHGASMTGHVSALELPPPCRHDCSFQLRALIKPELYEGALSSRPIRIVINGHVVFDMEMDQLWIVTCDVPAHVLTARIPVEVIFEHPAPPEAPAGDEAVAAWIWNLTLLGDSPLPPERAPVFSPPMFFTRPFGNLANRMIQHMVALAVQAKAPNCVLAGMELDAWGIRTSPDDGAWADLALVDEQHIDVAGVAALLQSRSVRKIVHRGFGQRMENFLPRADYRDVFIADEPDIATFDARHLVINVRAGDLVPGTMPHYVLTPLNFYRDLIAQTGLVPVFMGQLDPNPYTDALRAAFPGAIFHDSEGPVRDFETVRRAKNIVVSCSTFSWLAAWLSDADQVFLPVNGLFNPLQMPDVDLLPLSDPRYRFYLFPINHPAPDFAAAHQAIDGQWREVASDALAQILADGASPPPVMSPQTVPSSATAPGATSTPGDGPPMFDDLKPIVMAAEAAAARGYAVDVLHHLRQLGLADFADLMWSLPRGDLPGISALLPRMAPDDVQLNTTGKSGMLLAVHSVDFCRILASRFREFTGRSLDRQRVLDFGCGWGRVMRLLYWYTDPQNCCGVDANEVAIARCREDGVLGHLVKSDYLAPDFDAGERRYDMIVAYSVFTHTPLAVAKLAMDVLRRKLRSNGLLVITLRPVEFWERNDSIPQDQRTALAHSHRQDGFAYMPLGVTNPDGAELYGETSMTPAWITANFPDWEVEGTDRGLDPMELIVFLSPR